MSTRFISRLSPLLRRRVAARLFTHYAGDAGGLLRSGAARATRRKLFAYGISSIHNVPAVRNVSFARYLPNLFSKLFRIPAMFGGAMIAGLAYIQYQAARKSDEIVK